MAVRNEYDRACRANDIYDQQRALDELNNGSTPYEEALDAVTDAESDLAI